jgi:hypothetical protein
LPIYPGVVMIGACLVILGCAAPSGVDRPPASDQAQLTPVPGGGTRTEVIADWDDAHAAVLAALSRCETAFASQHRTGGPTDVDATSLRYELLTITEQSGTLMVSRGSADSTDAGTEVSGRSGARSSNLPPVPIVIEIRIGDAGDERFERCLAEAVVVRLSQLRGVRAAPLNW